MTQGLAPAVLDRIDESVTAAVDGGQAPGVVAGVACGDDVHVAVAGRATVDGAPMRRDSLFRITSMTKPMTAVVVLSLVESGDLGLDDPVERHLPELAGRRVLRHPGAELGDTVAAERPFTVRDVLTFTWGLGMQGAMFAADPPWPVVAAAQDRRLGMFGPPAPTVLPEPTTWLAGLAALPLLAQPGERWLYHAGSQVLGVLAARVAGVPLEQLMRERLFIPLGLADTSFWTEDADRLVTAYLRGPDGALVVSDPPDGAWARPPAFPDGGAGLVCTVDDYLTFAQMLARGGAGLLRPETVTAMTTDQLTDAQRRHWPGFDLLDGRGWGYGVAVSADGAYGWDGGFGTSWTNLPGTNLPGTDLPVTNLPVTNLSGTNSLGTDLPATNLPGTNLPGTSRPGTSRPGTDLPRTNSPGTNLPGTDLPGTNSPGTNSLGTDLPGTNRPGTLDAGRGGVSVVVLTQRAFDQDGPPAILAEVVAVARQL